MGQGSRGAMTILAATVAVALALPAAALELQTSCPFPMADAAPGQTRYWFDREYAVLAGRSQRYDLAMPAAPGHYPLILLLHGGGFVTGDKTDKFPEAELRALAAQGYAVATLNYALAGPAAGQGAGGRFPQAIRDLNCAVQHFRAGAAPEAGRIDTSRIAALGTSAGGHLALLLATAEDDAQFRDPACPHEGALPDIQAAAAFYPSTRFMTAAGDTWSGYGRVGRNSDFFRIFGTQPAEVEDLIRRGSPLYLVTTDPDPADIPPILLVNAADERNPLLTESILAMAEALDDRGVPHLYLNQPRGRHGYDPFAAFRASTCAALGFFDQTIGD